MMFTMSSPSTDSPSSSSRTVWLVDGSYLYAYGRGRPFDYLKLKHEVQRLNGGDLYESYYLNAVPAHGREGQQAFHNWLRMAAPVGPRFRVQLYDLKDMYCVCPQCDHSFSRLVPRGVDVGLATLMMRLATQNVCDRFILAVGDGEFEDAIAYIKSDLHKEVWLLGAQDTLSPLLQSYADHVIWLDDLAPHIARD